MVRTLFVWLFVWPAGRSRREDDRPARDELRSRVAAYVGDYGLTAAEAAKVTDEVVREIDDEEEGKKEWEADVNGRVEAARRRLRDADLFRRGFTLEQLEPFRLHYSR